VRLLVDTGASNTSISSSIAVAAALRPLGRAQVIAGTQKAVRHTYDRYSYIAEKRDALQKLATLVERIVTPPTDRPAPRL
jgi:hypothetical protein